MILVTSQSSQQRQKKNWKNPILIHGKKKKKCKKGKKRKNFEQTRNKRHLLHVSKDIYKIPTDNIKFNDEKCNILFIIVLS